MAGAEIFGVCNACGAYAFQVTETCGSCGKHVAQLYLTPDGRAEPRTVDEVTRSENLPTPRAMYAPKRYVGVGPLLAIVLEGSALLLYWPDTISRWATYAPIPQYIHIYGAILLSVVIALGSCAALLFGIRARQYDRPGAAAAWAFVATLGLVFSIVVGWGPSDDLSGACYTVFSRPFTAWPPTFHGCPDASTSSAQGLGGIFWLLATLISLGAMIGFLAHAIPRTVNGPRRSIGGPEFDESRISRRAATAHPPQQVGRRAVITVAGLACVVPLLFWIVGTFTTSGNPSDHRGGAFRNGGQGEHGTAWNNRNHTALVYARTLPFSSPDCNSTDLSEGVDESGGLWVGGPCRVVRLDAATGRELVSRTLPGDVSALVTARGGGVYITGLTRSPHFPVLHADQPKHPGPRDPVTGDRLAAFVARVARDGHLLWSTYLGGSAEFVEVKDIAVDARGNVLVVGSTMSATFPRVHPWAPWPLGGQREEAFIAEYTPDGRLIATTLYGDHTRSSAAPNMMLSVSSANAIRVGRDGSLYILGMTDAADFPITHTILPRTTGSNRFFLMRLSGVHHKVVYSVDFGSEIDAGGLTVDRVGDAYIGGSVGSGFPLRSAIERLKSTGTCGEGDYARQCNVAVIAKLSPSGTLSYSTYLGVPGYDSSADQLAIDSRGYAYVTGTTTGGWKTIHAPQPNYGGGQQDVFVTVLNRAGSRMLYSTYLGGSGFDPAATLAVDHAGAIYVAGGTNGFDFPGLVPLHVETSRTFLVKLPAIR
jgi:Beta-propeller repeat